MNTRLISVRTVFLSLLIALTIGAQAASAQDTNAMARGTVPFAFRYGTHTFRAGTYQLAMVTDNLMRIRGEHDSAVGIVSRGDTDKQPAKAKLVFQRNGDTYALRDIWLPNRSKHLVCPEGQAGQAA